MPTTVWPTIRSHVVRATKLDSCAAPVIGPKSTVVSGGHISLKLSPQYEDGEETNQKAASGKLRVVDKADDQLKYFTYEAVFAEVNPDIFNILTGQPIVLDYLGDAVGLRIGETINANAAVETWTDVPNTACGPLGKSYGYFLMPWMTGGRLGDFSFENALANFTITGRTSSDALWGVGPYDVVRQPPVAPSVIALPGPLLVPIASDQHVHLEPTTVAPPVETAGAIALA